MICWFLLVNSCWFLDSFGIVIPTLQCRGLVRCTRAGVRSPSTRRFWTEVSLPTSLPSSSTVITVSVGLHWTDAKRKVPPTSYFLRRSPDSVHRQSAELPCCASVRRTYSFTVRAHLKYGQRSLVVLVIVYCLPSVTHSAPCMCALKVSGSRPSCLSLTPLFLAELLFQEIPRAP